MVLDADIGTAYSAAVLVEDREALRRKKLE